ncbi:hypothetical protein [Phocaeicola plebeius]|jgi:hypothetical protein|uniref:hypothetical protein n=1 Tax=Phocaeicola plebeius TaxID=310297 RepID=UPI003AF05A39
MENISRKEAFDCALALYANVINTINEKRENLYDYALILQKHSLSPIICLTPGEFFNWNNNGYQEKTYAFIPIGNQYIENSILNQCGTNHEFYERKVSFEKFNAYHHPCSWIKEVLTRQYLKLSYLGDMLWENSLEYDSSFFSKIHTYWVRTQVDEVIIYFPYYSEKERQKSFTNLSGNFYQKMIEHYWED